ncbi:uncharacterized protein Z518_04084 [Rhinocladiella mackenziei CBS 650.93]|uniref:Uncharacterized protein n=1 Tax=Rhinocladiella mackenziei CBS 650.93 TaxID=1442369 RepID=A0A0D2JAG8_9EURO|nr:uncharacterized protein Z518_04084 [Rhinocladiella mackenziei CBS 650.93]KIX06110.1 hypothetical protein Z518_04084 [Rhinocladiella mackenziei CBS 650.93]
MISRTIGSSSTLSVRYGELVAIREACQLVDALWLGHDIHPKKVVTIFSNSQSALRVLAKPRQQSGQAIVRDILWRLQRFSQRWASRIQSINLLSAQQPPGLTAFEGPAVEPFSLRLSRQAIQVEKTLLPGTAEASLRKKESRRF